MEKNISKQATLAYLGLLIAMATVVAIMVLIPKLLGMAPSPPSNQQSLFINK